MPILSPARRSMALSMAALAGSFCSASPLQALIITDYDPEVHDRFSSGYSTFPLTAPPVPNTSPNFVAAGYDLSGVAWKPTIPEIAVGMLNEKFFLHIGHVDPIKPTDPYLQFLGKSGELYTATIAASAGDMGMGELTMGWLTEPIPASAGITSYRILDIGMSKDPPRRGAAFNYGNTTGLPGRELLLYGRTGRVAINSVKGLSSRWDIEGVTYLNHMLITGYTVGYEGGDSGSPVFFMEEGELLLTGSAKTQDGGTSFLGPPGVRKMNDVMAGSGYALKWMITESVFNQTWTGAEDLRLDNGNNYVNDLPSSDTSIIFKADEAAGGHLLSSGDGLQTRGMLFRPSATSQGFTIGGTGEIQVGFAGVRNLNTGTQWIQPNIQLDDAQHWEADAGDLRFDGNIKTSKTYTEETPEGDTVETTLPFLLIVGGAKNTQINGAISGTGALAKEGSGLLALNGENTFSGPVHMRDGTLSVTGSLAASSEAVNVTGGVFAYRGTETLSRKVVVKGGAFVYDSASAYTGELQFISGTLGGSGNLSNTSITVSAGKSIAPGNSAGTLTTGSQTWEAGGIYQWEIENWNGTVPGEDWDLLNINGTLSITAGSEVPFVLQIAGYEFEGFTEQDRDFLIASANDGIAGFDPNKITLDLTDFAHGSGSWVLNSDGSNLVLSYTAVPEPGSATLVMLGAFMLLGNRRITAE